jgi:hypothetical protein
MTNAKFQSWGYWRRLSMTAGGWHRASKYVCSANYEEVAVRIEYNPKPLQQSGKQTEVTELETADLDQ